MEIIECVQDGILKSKLKVKLGLNEKVVLTEEERLFLYNHLNLHVNCFSAEKKNESSCPNCELPKRRKTAKLEDVKPKRENDPPQELNNFVPQEINGSPRTVRPLSQVLKEYKAVSYDYEIIKTYLCDNFTLPLEERDQDTFLACFNILFESRRSFLIACSPTVAVVEKLHPYMFNREQVFAEFELIAQRKNMFEKYMDRVKKYSESVVELTEQCPSKNMICRKINKAEDGEQKEWMQMAGSLFLLPKYMGEDRRSILICDNEESIQKTTFPYVRCYKDSGNCLAMKCHFEVFIEDIRLCRVRNIVEAFYGLMAAYYIFNASYPKKCTKTLALFEKLYTEYSDSPTEIPQSAENRIAYLKKYAHKKE